MPISILHPTLAHDEAAHAAPTVRQDTALGSLARPALVLLLAFSALTGLAYPLLTTVLAQVAFPFEANGSLIESGRATVGSKLIGQAFDAPAYFWGRPSATAPSAYNASASTGSNLGPTNPTLVDAIQARIAALRAADPDNHLPVPVDLVTASGSGLDPDISPAAAYYQVGRVARARNLDADRVRALVDRYVEGRTFAVFGEPRVNVLGLNLALDQTRGQR